MFCNDSSNNLERGMRLRSRVLASPFSGKRFDLGVQQPPALAVTNGQCQGSASHFLESPVASQQGDVGNSSGSMNQLKDQVIKSSQSFSKCWKLLMNFVQIRMDKIKITEDEKLSQRKRNGSSPFPCGTPIPSELVRGYCTVENDKNSLQDKSNEKHSFVYPGSNFQDRENFSGNCESITSLINQYDNV